MTATIYVAFALPLFLTYMGNNFELCPIAAERIVDTIDLCRRHACHLILRHRDHPYIRVGSRILPRKRRHFRSPRATRSSNICLPGRSNSPWPSKVRDTIRAPVRSAAPRRRPVPRRSFSCRHWRAPYEGPGTRDAVAIAWTLPVLPCAAARSPVAAVSLRESRRTRSHRLWSASRDFDRVPILTPWSPPATAYWCRLGTSVPVDLWFLRKIRNQCSSEYEICDFTWFSWYLILCNF